MRSARPLSRKDLAIPAIVVGTMLPSVPASAQELVKSLVDQTVDLYKIPRPDYTPPGFYLGDFHFSGALPDTLPGNGAKPISPVNWPPMTDPMFAQSLTYDDNIYARRKYQSEDLVSTTTESLNFLADWDPDRLTGGFYAAQQRYYVHRLENTEAYQGDIAAQKEVLDEGYLDLIATFNRQPQARAGIVATTNVGFRPVNNEFNPIVSFSKQTGDLTTQIQYAFDKIAYTDAADFGRSLTQQSISSYIAYHFFETTDLFVKPVYQFTDYVLSPDLTNTSTLGITGGARYEIPGEIKAIVQVGLQQESFRNTAFHHLYQPQVDAFLLWDINEANTVIFSVDHVINPLVRFCNGICPVSPSQEIGVGPLVVTGGPNVLATTTVQLTAEHEFFHDLLGQLRIGFERDKFKGIQPNLVQDTYTLTTNMRYLINRNAELDLIYNFRSRTANFPNLTFYNSGPYEESVLSLVLNMSL